MHNCFYKTLKKQAPEGGVLWSFSKRREL